MSGTKGHSGGSRPSAPQNNPANISATGGAGQSGQAKTYIPGLPQGQGQSTYQQQGEAALYKAPTAGPTPAPQVKVPQITDPTLNPAEHVMSGAPTGPGPGPEALVLPQPKAADPDVQMVQNYLPILEYWAQQPDTPQSTKDYVQYLKTIVPTPGAQ